MPQIDAVAPTPKSTTAATRERIILAAMDVFAEQGLKGATTRQIAQRAQVNESTLFRHFDTKEALIQAVVKKRVQDHLTFLEPHSQWTGHLEDDLLHYAQALYQRTVEGEALIRVFIGEALRLPEASLQVCSTAGKPVRDQLLSAFQKAQDEGQIRPEIDLRQAADCFYGQILSYVLKSRLEAAYSPEAFLKTAVNIFVRGIQANPLETR